MSFSRFLLKLFFPSNFDINVTELICELLTFLDELYIVWSFHNVLFFLDLFFSWFRTFHFFIFELSRFFVPQTSSILLWMPDIPSFLNFQKMVFCNCETFYLWTYVFSTMYLPTFLNKTWYHQLTKIQRNSQRVHLSEN